MEQRQEVKKGGKRREREVKRGKEGEGKERM